MTNKIDETQLAEIEARANAATKGPWCQSALAGMYIVVDGTDFATIASVGEYNADGSIHLAFADAEANLRFITNARADIPALCATVRHLLEENRSLRGPCYCCAEVDQDCLSGCRCHKNAPKD